MWSANVGKGWNRSRASKLWISRKSQRGKPRFWKRNRALCKAFVVPSNNGVRSVLTVTNRKNARRFDSSQKLQRNWLTLVCQRFNHRVIYCSTILRLWWCFMAGGLQPPLVLAAQSSLTVSKRNKSHRDVIKSRIESGKGNLKHDLAPCFLAIWLISVYKRRLRLWNRSLLTSPEVRCAYVHYYDHMCLVYGFLRLSTVSSSNENAAVTNHRFA